MAENPQGAWWNGDGFRVHFPHGGSTLTQQLIRGYFLHDWSRHENDAILFRDTLTSQLLSAVVGVRTTNKLLRKLEEVRLSLWHEEAKRRRYGSPERATRDIYARSPRYNYLGRNDPRSSHRTFAPPVARRCPSVPPPALVPITMTS